MNIRRMLLFLSLVGLVAAASFGADITGKWKSESTGRDGTPVTTTYVFKVDGDKLTGTVTGRQGEASIAEGKINADEISFVVVRNFQGEDRKIQYKGKVSGDEIKFTIAFREDAPPREVVAKRVKD